MDYDPKVSSDVLDYLFKPGFGLNLQMLKVELGGDTDATEGAEPSHMHYEGDPGNYERGYEWWLMKEAKARNPDIKLYGLPWGWPGWLDPSATADKKATNAFANPTVTANYTLQWLLGAKRVHNLDIDYIGQWNERNAPDPYNKALAEMVQAAGLKTICLKRLPHYPGTGDKPDSKGCTQHSWNTTDGSLWVDEEGSWKDGRSARCLARCVNRNYITGCHTATFQWHLVSSFYDYLPWARCGVAVANTPWSGSYEVTSPTWALAHTSQFAPIGWRYSQHDKGVQLLAKGGSIVTRISEDAKDFSIVIEKMSGGKTSACARGSNPTEVSIEEEVTFHLKGSFAKASTLQVWYSNLTCVNGGNTQSVAIDEAGKIIGEAGPVASCNPPDTQLFLRKTPIAVGSDGSFTIKVLPQEMYTLTTLSTGSKGAHTIPPATPFPLPFKQSFDDESISAPPKYWYDQMGAWEIVKSNTSARGQVMRQVVPVWPACWGYSCTGPTTYFGPSSFNSSTRISFDLLLEDHAAITIAAGAALVLNTSSAWSFQDEKGTDLDFKIGTWNTVVMEIGANCSASFNGKVLASSSHKPGDGWSVKVSLDRYIFAEIDNFSIESM
jgi:galactosylceramidase